MTELELEQTLRNIFRNANKDLEENGCNSLFLTLGTLRWYDAKSKSPRYAPLIMIPVTLVRTHKGYSLEKLDEETLFNVTILEKMKQDFGLNVPNMDPLPTDDSGVDVELILQSVRKMIASKEGWEVLNGAALGLFSFSQYVMWKDLLTNVEDYKDNLIVNCLCNGTVYQGSKEIDEDSDPYDLCLTVPADGSQIRAVKAVANGRTFVMHGPPGTGKSQTITNIICNELYNGRTVLFVAEKRAALDVVQKRLVDVGIENRCLELHSNKTEKSKIMAQIRSAYNSSEAINDRALRETLGHLITSRNELDEYVSALHKEMPWGLSAYDCICRYQKYDEPGATDMLIPTNYVTELNDSDLFSLEGALSDAYRAYHMVPEYARQDLKQIWFKEYPISLEEDYVKYVSDAKYASEALIEQNEQLTSLELPINLDSSTEVEVFVNTITSLNRTFIELTDVKSTLDNAKSLSQEIKTILEGFDKLERAVNLFDFDFDTISLPIDAVWPSYSHLCNGGLLKEDESISSISSSLNSIRRKIESLIPNYNTILDVW
ncbi:MAG: DUF4011 domain-containing protein, partial [Candidatus Methanomethylophilaceae archaeon]|nr:DUF4011 domain-containing protein [Candidatus Methanomethylophilaceae archaeon]